MRIYSLIICAGLSSAALVACKTSDKPEYSETNLLAAATPTPAFVVDRCEGFEKRADDIGQIIQNSDDSLRKKVKFANRVVDMQDCFIPAAMRDSDLGLNTGFRRGAVARTACSGLPQLTGRIYWVTATHARIFSPSKTIWADKRCLELISQELQSPEQSITKGDRLLVVCDGIETKSETGKRIGKFEYVEASHIITHPDGTQDVAVIAGALSSEASPQCFEKLRASVALDDGYILQRGKFEKNLRFNSQCGESPINLKSVYVADMSSNWIIAMPSPSSSTRVPLLRKCLSRLEP